MPDTEEEALREQLAEAEEEAREMGVDTPLGYGSPEAEKKDSLFKFFREIIKSEDSRKIGNLTDVELGKVKRGVRHYFDIANYARVEGLNIVAAYLEDKAENILATSDSRKGFLLSTVVTQIKKQQKLSDTAGKVKGGLFSAFKKPQDESPQ